MDWSKCALCQADNLNLIFPAQNNNTKTCGYSVLASNIGSFLEANLSLPKKWTVTLDDLKGNSDISEHLRIMEAKWHKNCALEVSQSRLHRALIARDRIQDESHEVKSAKQTRTSLPSTSTFRTQKCFFCGLSDSDNENDPQLPSKRKEHGKTEVLHCVESFDCDKNIRQAATEMGDTQLLVKLSEGDLIAREARYHKNCMNKFTNRYRAFKNINASSAKIYQKKHESIALAEVMVFIEEQLQMNEDEEVAPFVKLSTVRKFYSHCLEHLNAEFCTVNSTRLKENILTLNSNLEASNLKKEVYISYKDDLAAALRFSRENSFESDATHLSRAANILRKDIASVKQTFTGYFNEKSQVDSVPSSLLSFIHMLTGSLFDPTDDDDFSTHIPALSIAQLVQFNVSIKRAKGHFRHNADKETPLSIYIAFLLHSSTRSRVLIDKFYDLGLCISYQRMLNLSTALGNGVCERFENEGFVCPPLLRKRVFTTYAVDNIDHNPSSRTARDSWHGTAISATQHLEYVNDGEERSRIKLSTAKKNCINKLPLAYTNVHPYVLKTKDITVPERELATEYKDYLLATQLEKAKLDHSWLKKVAKSVQNDSENLNKITWAAYQSTLLDSHVPPKAITALLPLFREHANTPAMIHHAIMLVKKQTDHLNPGQTPVMTADQPLYALAKEIQWSKPDILGENNFLVMMGDLHIEMTFMKCLGNLLEASGWTFLLSSSTVLSTGKANAMLSASSNLVLCRYVHEVTACSLYIKRNEAYQSYVTHTSIAGQEVFTEEEWEVFSKQYPMFRFWNLILQLEFLLLDFVKSIRSGKFEDYIQALLRIVPWMFSLDHHNYARWLPVYINELTALQQHHPQLYEEFMKGKFTVQKSTRKFSKIGLDQNHEQMNSKIKGVGGAIGLTENDQALRRWLISGPEIARIIEEFEAIHLDASQEEILEHHDAKPSSQLNFQKDVKLFLSALEEQGNPFLDESGDLYALDTKEVANQESANSLFKVENIGQQQFQTFVEERIWKHTTPISDTISKNNIHFFATTKARSVSKKDFQLKTANNNVALFSRLFIACQARGGDLEVFFAHENQTAPPSLSDKGELRPAKTKSGIIECLMKTEHEHSCETPSVDAKIFDGPCIVNMLRPTECRTFSEYAANVFLPYVELQLRSVQRVDLVWDRYFSDSLKGITRNSRGVGVRKKVTENGLLPRNWTTFLRCSENKTELFQFLSRHIQNTSTEKVTVATYDSDVITNKFIETSGMMPCTIEEADERVFIHANDAAKEFSRILIKTVDSDVVIIAVSVFHRITGIQELWIEYGLGKHLKYIPIHQLASAMGTVQCEAFLFFHAISGCDTTSSVHGKSKKTFHDTWLMLPELTPVFSRLCTITDVTDLSTDDLKLLERFFVILYSPTCNADDVNTARRLLFAQGNRSMENVPPTAGALKQHILRSALQAGKWQRCLQLQRITVDPTSWGWTMTDDRQYVPFWSELPVVSIASRELVKCGCKKSCKGRCKCKQQELPCTELCACSGQC